jgi:6-phosphogluconolactonase (cycloisomerase 2 family)
VASQGDEPTHASLSRDQRYLFVANYAVARPRRQPGGDPGGQGRQAQSRGATGPAQGERVNPERQAGAHVHSLVLSPDGQHLYACDLGADKVFIYRYDGASADTR